VYNQPKSSSTLVHLGIVAKTLNDIEIQRIATSHRINIAVRPLGQLDKDGKGRGLGINPQHPMMQHLLTALGMVDEAEDEIVKQLQDLMAQHPLSAWVKRTQGVGAKQVARLLAATGDPYWHSKEDRPRTVHELWSYCGLRVADGKAVRRQRGEVANWSTEAKSRAYVIAAQCLRYDGKGQARRSPYRDVYDNRRAVTAERTHSTPCPPCGGPKSTVVGTPWEPGHAHADALRVTSKQILLDLWLEFRKIHGAELLAA
jgi:hypothetical protein